MRNLKRMAIEGARWSLAGHALWLAVMAVVCVSLARLLAPAAFGLMAMVTVVSNCLRILAEMGLGVALVQGREHTEEEKSSIFWFSVCCGCSAAAALALGAPWLGRLYGAPEVVPVALALAVPLVAGSLSVVQQALFSRRLDLKAIATAEVISVTAGGMAAVFLAWRGFGVWSLVAQSWTVSWVNTAALWTMSEWRPRAEFRWAPIREKTRFGAAFVANSFLNYWTRNLDNLLIGVVLGSHALGVYGKAYLVMLFPMIVVERVHGRVLFPSLSMIKDDPPRVKALYLKFSRAVALMAFPLMMGVFVAAREFVLAIFGPRWEEMVPVLRILSLVGMAQAPLSLVGGLFLSQGRPDLQFKVGAGLKAVQLAGIAVGLKWGIVGVAEGYAAGTLLTIYPNFHFAGKLVGLGWTEFARSVRGTAFCSSGMAFGVWLLGLVLPGGLPDSASLAVRVIAGAVIYFGLLHWTEESAWREVKELGGSSILPVRSAAK